MNPLLCWARSSNELMQSTASVEARLEQLTADSMAATKGLNKAAHILNLQPHVECPVHATADQVCTRSGTYRMLRCTRSGTYRMLR